MDLVTLLRWLGWGLLVVAGVGLLFFALYGQEVMDSE